MLLAITPALKDFWPRETKPRPPATSIANAIYVAGTCMLGTLTANTNGGMDIISCRAVNFSYCVCCIVAKGSLTPQKGLRISKSAEFTLFSRNFPRFHRFHGISPDPASFNNHEQVMH